MKTSHTLAYPIDLDGTTITEVEVRRPKVGDHTAVDNKKGLAKEVALLARLTGLSTLAVQELDELDYNEIGKIVEDFRRPAGSEEGNGESEGEAD